MLSKQLLGICFSVRPDLQHDVRFRGVLKKGGGGDGWELGGWK